MSRPNYPRSFSEAQARLNGDEKAEIVRDNTTLARVGEEIRLIANEIPLVTFRPDGSIKICTSGRNDWSNLWRINNAIPERYRVRRRGCRVALVDMHANARAVGDFMTSLVFTPEGNQTDG